MATSVHIPPPHVGDVALYESVCTGAIHIVHSALSWWQRDRHSRLRANRVLGIGGAELFSLSHTVNEATLSICGFDMSLADQSSTRPGHVFHQTRPPEGLKFQ